MTTVAELKTAMTDLAATAREDVATLNAVAACNSQVVRKVIAEVDRANFTPNSGDRNDFSDALSQLHRTLTSFVRGETEPNTLPTYLTATQREALQDAREYFTGSQTQANTTLAQFNDEMRLIAKGVDVQELRTIAGPRWDGWSAPYEGVAAIRRDLLGEANFCRHLSGRRVA